MDLLSYPIIYKDKFGEEKAKITTFGTTLHIKLRDTRFEGQCFETLEISEFDNQENDKFEWEKCQDSSKILTNFEIKVKFQIQLAIEHNQQMEEMIAQISTGNEKGTNVFLELKTDFGDFKNTKNYDSFEDALLEMQSVLPKNIKIKTCVSCKFSNYHPIGNGMFGGLYCFKKLAHQVDKIVDKRSLLHCFDKEFAKDEEKQKIFNVQETFDCLDHRFPKKSNWTYKNWIE
ncbi:DUF6304 family protein [Bernardetia sp. MNP-M8]|uniref:DUF6304 family protein n=1 Tax=Bernardetia sp. MNP-M8 TaxID=3127470 RepID=UPI0030CCA543